MDRPARGRTVTMGRMEAGERIVPGGGASRRARASGGSQSPRTLAARFAEAWGGIRFELNRRRLARRFLRGSGLEIGALDRPLRTSSRATVRYVDRMDAAGLRRHYPELAGRPLVAVHIVDDGERLATQADASVDFIIANHFIEHTQDPLGTLENHLRVLRPGGVIYLAVPDRRRTFDIDRPATPLEHLIRDHRDGPAWSRKGHQEEWARFVDRVPEDEVAAKVERLEREDYSIHFHVWQPSEFNELLEYARGEGGLAFVVEELKSNDLEFIVVLRRI
jgi:SAM-dependent methyltransferase